MRGGDRAYQVNREWSGGVKYLWLLLLAGCAAQSSTIESQCEVTLPDGTEMVCKVGAEHDEINTQEIPKPAPSQR